MVERLALRRPRPGVTYPEVLALDEPTSPSRLLTAVRGMAGSALGMLLFLIVVPLVVAAIVGLAWLVAGQPGEFGSFSAQARAFENPAGMVAAHLGLAMLIPISFGLMLMIHRVHPRWLHSVRPGLRWGFGLAAMLVAAVVLNAVLVASRWGQDWTIRPQPGFWWFAVAIVLTSPLQAAAEEYFFRGYLMQALSPIVRGPWFGIVASAALFAAFHGTQNLPLFLDRFGFGLLAGILALKTGGLEAGIAAHVVNNICAFGYAGLTSTIAEVKATQVIGWADAGWDLAGFGLFTLGAIWLARRWGLETRTPPEVPGLAGGGGV